jgi:hypothetical protein
MNEERIFLVFDVGMHNLILAAQADKLGYDEKTLVCFFGLAANDTGMGLIDGFHDFPPYNSSYFPVCPQSIGLY